MAEQQRLRMAKWRLAILGHAEESLAMCPDRPLQGHQRPGFATWRRREDAHGRDGLKEGSESEDDGEDHAPRFIIANQLISHLSSRPSDVQHSMDKQHNTPATIDE